MRTTKHNYKDSLFRDIFNNAERLPELCEALLGLKTMSSSIALATINETLFTGLKNDVSFIVENQHVLLVEHQSAVNANMPLRFFMYLAEIYRRYVEEEAMYKKRLIPLPTPKFYVFYNGIEEMPDTWTLRLSDAFGGKKDAMELVVEVLNINDKSNRRILEKCHALKGYSVFIAQVREHIKNGGSLETAVGDAVRYCIANDYLKEYFRQKHKEEVFDMLNFAWNQELALKVRADEAREEGLSQGLENGLVLSIRSMMEKLNLSMEKAMDVLQIPAAERAKYAALIKG